jgi:hypothetical protein
MSFNNLLRLTLLVFFGLTLPSLLHAQQGKDSLFIEFDKLRIQHQKHGMIVLGSWAGLNMGSGLILRNNTLGATKYFHEMNVLWNSVNLVIALNGFAQTQKEQPATSPFKILDKQLRLEKNLLFNAGIDVAYSMAGLWMLERANQMQTQEKRDRLRGYGRSLIMQGAFLFAYDLGFFLVENNSSRGLRESMNLIYLSPGGFSFQHRF